MRTISLKFPAHLENLVEAEAKRRRVSKSAVVRACVEEVLLKHPKAKQQLTCADLMGDLIGSLEGPSDLSTNKRYLDEAIMEDFQCGLRHHCRRQLGRRMVESERRATRVGG
ncbi:MAG: hypothetical protein AB7P69_21240 [Candidatus Binatia bacterium]